jgi:hypothetical protein
MRFKIDPKKLEEAEGELLTDFSNFVEEKRHPNICVCKNKPTHLFSTIKISIDYYPHRINKIEIFWEKKMFNILLEMFGAKTRIEIIDVYLTPGLWDINEGFNPYYFKCSILLKIKIISI